MSGEGLLRGGLNLGAGTVASRLLGFVRAALLAWVLGTIGSRSADAFTVANQLPNNVFWLISSGVFAAVIVPQVVRAANHDDGGESYVNKLLTIGLCLLAAITAVAIALAPWLVQLYTQGWGSVQLKLAVAFALWCMPQIFFYGVFSLFGEVLNARRKFAPAAWAPLANNFISIAGLVVFAVAFGVYPDATGSIADWDQAMVALVGGSTTLGVVVQAAVLFVAWNRAGGRFRPDFRWRGVNLGGASRVAMWTFAIVVLGQLLGIVQSRVFALATGLGASLFASSTAWLLFMLPYSVIAVTIGTIYFTRFSELGAAGDERALAHEVGSTARVLVIAMAGAAAAMVFVSLPIGRVFTESTSSSVAMALLLLAYLVCLVPFAMLLLVQRVFYALGDARTPFLYTCVQAVIIVGGTVAVPFVAPSPLIAVGVALVQSIATTVQAVIAFLLVRRRLGPVGGRGIVTAVLRSGLAILAASVVTFVFGLWAIGPALNGWAMSNRIIALFGAAAIGVVFAASYVTVLWLQRETVVTDALRRLRAGASVSG